MTGRLRDCKITSVGRRAAAGDLQYPIVLPVATEKFPAGTILLCAGSAPLVDPNGQVIQVYTIWRCTLSWIVALRAMRSLNAAWRHGPAALHHFGPHDLKHERRAFLFVIGCGSSSAASASNVISVSRT
jgi:hypothetical protein